jgi:hypothetical protein
MPTSQPVTPDWVRVFSFGEVTSRFYRLIFGQPEGLRDLPLAELDLSGGYRIGNIDAKAAFTRQDVPARSAVAAVTAGDPPHLKKRLKSNRILFYKIYFDN